MTVITRRLGVTVSPCSPVRTLFKSQLNLRGFENIPIEVPKTSFPLIVKIQSFLVDYQNSSSPQQATAKLEKEVWSSIL